MGWLSVLLPGGAALFFFKTKHLALMVIAIFVSVGCFWSWGIMHNFATIQARRRSDYSGGFYDLTTQEVEAVPDWITRVNLLFSLIGLVLLIVGIVIAVK